MKKKLLLLVLTLLAISLTFIACKNKNEPQQTWVELEQKQFNLTVGEKQSLMPAFTQVEGVTLRFESSNDDVVSVSDVGVMRANKVGEATVKVYYGKAYDTARVTVGLGGLIPMLNIPAVYDDSVTLRRGDFVDLSGVISFNGVDFYDAELSYTVLDSQIGTVVDTTFTAGSVGETYINITASWNGYDGVTMQKTIKVTVVPTVEISLDDGLKSALTLYSLDDTVLTYRVTCKQDGEDIPYSIEVTSGEQYINFTNSSVQSKGIAGNAEITVSCSDSYGNDYEKKIPVYVKHTVYSHGERLPYFSAYDGDFIGGKTLRQLLGEDITAVKDSLGNSLNVRGNKAYDLPTSNTEVTSTVLTVYGSTYALEIPVEAYTRVIDEADDFSIFNLGVSTWSELADGHVIDGYYVLKNNVDAGEYSHPQAGDGLVSGNAHQAWQTSTSGFVGTLDGNGYTVDSMTYPMHGIFGHINGGTVKNIGFTNCKFVGSSGTAVLASYVYRANISNVYVHADKFGTGTRGVGIIWNDCCDTIVENVLINVPTTYAGNGDHGSISYLFGQVSATNWPPTFFRETYVISPVPLVYRTTRSFVVDAINRTNTVVPEGFDLKNIEGVTRYDTVADMALSNKTFGSFNEAFWTVDEGVLKFNNKPNPIVDESQFDVIIRDFSAYDGDVGNLLPLFNALSDQAVSIEKAYQGSRELTVSGSKILGVKPNFVRENGDIVGINLTGITVVGKVGSESKTIEVGLYAYSHVIDEASDLAIFHEDVADDPNTPEDERYLPESGTPFSGYYVLKNDIDASSYVHACPNEHNTFMGINAVQVRSKGINLGLKGTFDGRGYTIDGLTVTRNGLFGFVNGGVVKDVAFTNVKIAYSPTSSSFIHGGILGTYVVDATITNVYAQVVEYVTGQGVASMWVDSLGSNVSNVLVEMPEITGMSANNIKYGYGSLSVWGNDVIDESREDNVYDNVYVISKTVLSQRLNTANNQNYILDAANRTDTQAPPTLTGTGDVEYEGKLYLIEGITRLDELSDVTATVHGGYWSITDGVINWQKPVNNG